MPTSKRAREKSNARATGRPTASRSDPKARNEPAKRKPAGRSKHELDDRVTQAVESGEPRLTGRSRPK